MTLQQLVNQGTMRHTALRPENCIFTTGDGVALCQWAASNKMNLLGEGTFTATLWAQTLSDSNMLSCVLWISVEHPHIIRAFGFRTAIPNRDELTRFWERLGSTADRIILDRGVLQPLPMITPMEF